MKMPCLRRGAEPADNPARSATARLSAHYTPPSGTPEGQLSASYDWSVSSVQYKAAKADQFGSPPANSYTDSISLPMRRDKLCRVSGGDIDVYAQDFRLLADIYELQRDRDGYHNQSILERHRQRRAGVFEQGCGG